MPQIAEIKVEGKDVWCRVELQRNTDVLGPITLWSPDEIKQHDRSLLYEFVCDLVDKFLESR